MNVRKLSSLLLSLLTLVVLGCGGSGSGTSTDLNAPATLSVTTPAASLINTPLTITANVLKADGSAVANGTAVTFTVSAGSVSAVTTTTNGVATATLSGITSTQTVSITASAGGVTSPVKTVNFVDPVSLPGITLTGSSTTGFTNDQGPVVTISANVSQPAPAGGPVPAGTIVNFTITSGAGTLSSTSSATDASGKASVTLKSTVAGNVSVKATVGSTPPVTSNTVSVSFADQPTLVTVKLATSGTLPGGTLIGGIHVIVTANPSAGLSIQDSDVTASGASVGSSLTPNTTNVASIQLALINTSGFQAGEFATLTYRVAPGALFPAAGNFGITPVSVIDTGAIAIPGVTVTIQSVTFQ